MDHSTQCFEGLRSQHEPRLPANGLTPRPNPPASVHPEVAAQRESSFEAQEEVLADRVDPFQSPAGEPFGDAQPGGARMRRFHLEPLADENLQTPRCAVDAVALGHVSVSVGELPRGLGGNGARARARQGLEILEG